MRATTNGTPKPQSALLLAVLILALLGAQTYWLYRWHGFNEDLLLANTRRSGENALDSRKITDLIAASVRINGLYLRLQDPLPSSAPNLPQLPASVGYGLPQTEPTVIQDLVKMGLAAVPSAVTRTEASSSYDLGSTRFEFHRLIPLIAQAENSNVLLFFDHLELVRPKTTEPFSASNRSPGTIHGQDLYRRNKMIIHVVSLLLGSALSLYAQVELPELDIYNYLPSQRDPFISSRALTTLLDERVEIPGVASTELMHRFLEKLTKSIKDQLSVGGLSTDDNQLDATALINGMTFHQGDTVPLDLDDKTLRELDQLAQSFGLTLTRTPENAIAIEIGRISSVGVDFQLPGFRASICQLPLETDEPSTTIKLTKKLKDKKP